MSSSNPNWDGWITLVCFDKKRCKCSLKKDGMHFPAGLFSQAKSFFKENGIEYTTIDLRSSINTFEINFNNKYSLRDYQDKIVNDSFAKTRGIVKAAAVS